MESTPMKYLALVVLLVAAACTTKNEPSAPPAPQRQTPSVTAPDPWLVKSPQDQPR